MDQDQITHCVLRFFLYPRVAFLLNPLYRRNVFCIFILKLCMSKHCISPRIPFGILASVVPFTSHFINILIGEVSMLLCMVFTAQQQYLWILLTSVSQWLHDSFVVMLALSIGTGGSYGVYHVPYAVYYIKSAKRSRCERRILVAYYSRRGPRWVNYELCWVLSLRPVSIFGFSQVRLLWIS